ncbi:MAG: helix-turn-helix domain-containing protein [Euryarchaeota archaeon]|nr:helix-turn-helix domain-containing protein [Euryarchaeota archaeon]
MRTAPDAIFLVSATTGVIVDVNDAAERLLGRPREQLVGLHQSKLHPAEETERYRAAFEEHADHGGVIRDKREFEVIHAEGHRIPVEISACVTELDGERIVQGMFRDITERECRERELSRQRDELKRLDRINTVIRRINRALIDADTHDGIETAVCERLAGTGPYRFAWIGEVDLAAGRVVPRTWAGIEEGYLDGITITTDGETAQGPTGRAVRTGEIQVMQDILDDPAYEPWRENAIERGYQSSCAVALGYEETIYGVLNVYADQPRAFDEGERAVLSELGELIGHAINAVERKEALMTESHVELEFQVRDAIRPLIEALDGDVSTLRFERTVPTDDGSYLVYTTMTGMAGERFTEAITTIPGVARARQIADETLFELTMDDPPLISAIASHGGRVRSVVVEDGVLRGVAVFPHNADIRAAVGAIRAAYADAELIAQRRTASRERASHDRWPRLDDGLTEKQRSALEAAYFSGFFEWPRASTGEEVADSLDIAAPTFSQHLRAAERKVFSTFLEESNE